MVIKDTAAPMCHWCRHLYDTETGLKCSAFPDGIPEVILDSEFDHRQAYRGDHGIRYEPHPKAPPPAGYLERLFPPAAAVP